MAAVHLFDMTVELAGPGPLRDELFLRAARDLYDHDERERDRQDRDAREERADRQHHHEHPDDGEN